MTTRSEHSLYTVSGVHVSRVRWHRPLPDSRIPQMCADLAYLRFRSVAAGQTTPEVVLSLQPGNVGGPSSFDALARNLITTLSLRGIHCEIWAMERRTQSLADATGMRAAVAAGDYRVAVDYYYRRRPLDGKVYARRLPARSQRFLAEFGLAQAIDDWHFVHTREMPDRADRARRLFIGGHSLGGPLSNFYCQWEFPDGPGYEEVAGVLGLDGPITVDPLRIAERRVPRTAVAGANQLMPLMVALMRAGLMRTSNTWGAHRLGDVATLTTIAAIAARFEPDLESDVVRSVPHGLEPMLRVLYPRGGPGRWRLTNAALFGTLFGRSAQGTTLSADLGSYTGPVLAKRRIVTRLARRRPTGTVAALFSPRPQVMPADIRTLTGWQEEADSIASFDDTVFAWANGEFSYINGYESRLLRTESMLAMAGARPRGCDRLRHRDWEQRVPNVVLAGDVWAPIRERRNPDPAEVDAKGYSHQDLLSARQPDIVVSTVADFLSVHSVRRTA